MTSQVEVMDVESGEAGKGMERKQNRGSNTDSQLKFKDVQFAVASTRASRGTKQILHGVSGGVDSGEVLAIMVGPAPAGYCLARCPSHFAPRRRLLS
jgi:hypothetical protein